MKEALLLGSLIAAVGYLFVPLRWARGWPSSGIKTVAIGALALAAFLSGFAVLGLALSLCAMGDLALSRPGERAFLWGMIAFGAAHLAYIVLIMSYGSIGWVGPGIFTGCVITLAAFCMIYRLWPVAGALRWPVMGYIAVILGMGLVALQNGLFHIPALLFILSDILVAYQRFLTPIDSRWRGLQSFGIWVFYYLAQLGFLLMCVAINAL